MAHTTRINPRHQYAAPWLAAMSKGMRRHGIRIVDHTPDIEVVWSYNQDSIINPQLQVGHDVLVLECGYLGDRSKSSSCGFNGLNGRAWFPTGEGRGEQWRHLLKPAHGGDYVVVIGQCFGDRSVRGLGFESWAIEAAQGHDLPVYYRPHPLQPNPINGLNQIAGTLEDVLRNAQQVITYNSNTGVDAVLAGCNVVAHDRGSMVYEFSGKPLANRDKWLNKMAFCQWNLKEIEDGTAWEHLSTRYA